MRQKRLKVMMKGIQQMFFCIILLIFEPHVSILQESSLRGCTSSQWGKLCPTEKKLVAIRDSTERGMTSVIHVLQNEVREVRLEYAEIAESQTMNTFNEKLRHSSNRSSTLEHWMKNIDSAVTQSTTLSTATGNAMNHLRSRIVTEKEKLSTLQYNCTRPAIPRRSKIPYDKIPVTTGKDCAEIHYKGARESGFYFIRPEGTESLIRVFCDMDDRGGGWTVIQRRFDGSVDFDRDWESYKWGFGQRKGTDGEYWIGNEYIHLLTTQNFTELQVDLVSWDNVRRYALYRFFQVSSEDDNYVLKRANGFFMDQYGNIGDSIEGSGICCSNSSTMPQSKTSHKWRPFATKDRGNDRNTENRAGNFRGGWWHSHCVSANLNGRRRQMGENAKLVDGDTDGMVWVTWRGCWETMKESRMKIRPFGFRADEAPILPPETEIRRRLLNSSSKLARRLLRRGRGRNPEDMEELARALGI